MKNLITIHWDHPAITTIVLWNFIHSESAMHGCSSICAFYHKVYFWWWNQGIKIQSIQCSFESRYDNLHFVIPWSEKGDWMKVYWIKLASELEAGTVLWSIKLWLPKSFLEKLVLQVQLICLNHYGLGLHLVSSNFVLKDVAWVNYCIIWGTCI